MRNNELRKSWQRTAAHLRVAVASLKPCQERDLAMYQELVAAREWGLAFEEVVALAARGYGTPESWRARAAAAAEMKLHPDDPVHGAHAAIVAERASNM